MSEPLVLLALGDDPVAARVKEALGRRDPPLRVSAVANVDELADRGAHESAALFLASSSVDDSGGVDCVRRLARASPSCRAVVLFTDPADSRRALVSAAGAYDYIVSPDGDFAPLVAIIDRMLTRSSLEQRLDATERHVRALVDNSNDGIYILKGGRFTYVNPRFEEMVRYSARDLLSEDFQIETRIVAPESRASLRERQARIQQGLPVEPRYEFESLRGDDTGFSASVSVSYIEEDGEPATLGIMQDITERKLFEDQLVRKNRELALLNELAASVNSAVELDETLHVGCRRVNELLGFAASGITLLNAEGSSLELRVQEGLDDALITELTRVATGKDSLLAYAVRTGQVQLVDSLHEDERVAIRLVRETDFEGAIVVPLESRGRIIGAAFFFTRKGRRPRAADTDLMMAIGSLLGTAIERATLLEKERAVVRRLRALDNIALVVANTLDVEEMASAVARSVARMFDASRVLMARYVGGEDILVPLCALEDGVVVEHRALSHDESLMGRALDSDTPVQRLRERGAEPVPSYDQALFDGGIGATLSVRVVLDGAPVGAMHLAFRHTTPLPPDDLEALTGIANHVAITMKNAELFAARMRALDDLKSAQDKLVQSEKLHALGELAAGVAHDFNNVLGAILGRAQLLKKKLTDPLLTKHAEIIEKAANDGAETVRRIQELGRGETTADFVDVDVHEILEDVRELTVPRWRDRTRSEGRPVDLEIVPYGHGSPIAQGNPHELREVLINLVHNAVDAMPQGGPLILRAQVTGESDGEAVVIEVEDCGTGMPDAVKARIFDPFFTTKGQDGTGLGLSVSFSIVQRHGGDLEVTSVTEGEHTGTTFRMTLPCRLGAARRVEAPPVETGAVALGENARVLVIDDEENIRDILTDILETGDHEVVTAEDGPEGLKRLDEMAFDLVFTDLGLPGMSGYEVAAAIKARFPNLPVGLVTGWGASLDTEKAQRNGVDLVLSKPFRFDQVLKLVDDALAARLRGAGKD